ncbi:MAG: c-type cytochrome biogenesis protein CcmI [Neomegalonema sp.]|nr:c-type cytochrome biogenesis protein CcmI [Neomegalonema sp.]
MSESDPSIFAIIGTLLGVGALTLALAPLWRNGGGAENSEGAHMDAERAAREVEVLRSAMLEVERDLARGALGPSEAETARRELARRLIAADTAAARVADDAAPSADAPSRAMLYAFGLGACVLASAFLLHAAVGAPLAPDRPHAKRNFAAERAMAQMSQAEAEAAHRASAAALPEPDAEIKALLDRLAKVVASRPLEREGRRRLADAHLKLKRPDRAWPILLEIAALSTGKRAEDAHLQAGRAMALAAGGYISREASEAFRRAGSAPAARFFLGLAALQRRDKEGAAKALEIWNALYADHATAPAAVMVRTQILEIAAGVGLTAHAITTRIGGAPRAALETYLLAQRLQLETTPRDIPGWVEHVRLLRAVGRPDAARNAGRRAIILLGRDRKAMVSLGTALQNPWTDTPSATPGALR